MKRRYVYLGIVFVAAWMFVQFSQETGSGSSFSYSPSGVRALFMFLKENGVETEAWLHPFAKLEKGGKKQTMFIISPSKEANLSVLRPWVMEGNRLVTLGLAPSIFSVPKKGAKAKEESERDSKKEDDEPIEDLVSSFDVLKVGDLETIRIRCPGNREALCGNVKNITQMRTSFWKVERG